MNNINELVKSVDIMKNYIKSYYELILNAWVQHIDMDVDVDIEESKIELMDAFQDIQTRIEEYDGVEYNKYYILCNALNDEINAHTDYEISLYYMKKGGKYED